MHINADFDAGNIIVDSVSPAGSGQAARARLSIRRDHKSDFFQWFYFRLAGARDERVELAITNAGEAAYADGWPGYRACVSSDRETWTRVDTSYADGTLTLKLTPDDDVVWLAYFAPYTMERHFDLLADVAASPLARVEQLGTTLDGQPLDMAVVGTPGGTGSGAAKKRVWLIARQHPGETMAEWWMEGAFDFLLDDSNPVARRLLDQAVFYIVPNMNPDGSRRGHLRTNAAGVNLNRVWNAPEMETSPEVFLVRQKMLDVGVDFHLDVHGDEALPYNFLAGYEGIPDLADAHLAKFHRFQDRLVAESPDFQKQHGYPEDARGSSDLKKCTDWTAHHFGCMAATLEMPFKDNADLPDDTYGWSPERCGHLAAACLKAISATLADD